MNLLQLIKYGGLVGHTIILLSFVAVALSIEYAYSIRLCKAGAAERHRRYKKAYPRGQGRGI